MSSRTYLSLIKERIQQRKTHLCLGLDPDITRIPLQGPPVEVISTFIASILEALAHQDLLPAVVKPNSAFFERHGLQGMRALQNCIELCHRLHLPVILDAKRGDIGNTAKNYAISCYECFNAQATTLSPYMGRDTLAPYLSYLGEGGRGAYLVVHSSNPGAADLQKLQAGSPPRPIFHHVAQWLVDLYLPGLGAVAPATDLPGLQETIAILQDAPGPVALLIPGIGTQGGSGSEVMEQLKQAGGTLADTALLNVSSGILYAYKKVGTDDYCGAAVEMTRTLLKEMR